MEGANIFDMVEAGSHDRLRRLMEENLGAVSKEAIASALRHQGTTFEALLARSEKAKEQGDSSFFSASGEPPHPPAPSGKGAAARASDNIAVDVDCSTDGGESEVASSMSDAFGRTSSSASTGGGDGGIGGGSSGGDSGSGSSAIRSRRKSLPPLGPAVFRTAAGGAGGGGGVGGQQSTTSGVGGSSGAAAATLAPYDVGAEVAGGGGTVTSVDRDLQSKINAFTNNRKVRDTCGNTVRYCLLMVVYWNWCCRGYWGVQVSHVINIFESWWPVLVSTLRWGMMVVDNGKRYGCWIEYLHL